MSMKSDIGDFFKLNPEHVKMACKIAGDAFQEDPFTKFVYPDENVRKQKLQHAFLMPYTYGIRHGMTYATSSNLEGVIIWLPPGKIYASTWTMMKYGGFRTIFKVGFNIKALKRSIAVFAYMEARHKHLVPYDHWYIQNLAVKPKEQGKGHGSSLIRAMFKRIDPEGLPIYLETNNERNISLYRRHGFEILEHSIIPNTDNVPLWCMLRKPI
ncbi:MAG: GNAT family N-acetyltransferase [Candidatus Lokiarchaeota archaeon]|nr:GNAT family N-acetyltransferase [Candidatus Lokiarchaeota archaeon]